MATLSAPAVQSYLIDSKKSAPINLAAKQRCRLDSAQLTLLRMVAALPADAGKVLASFPDDGDVGASQSVLDATTEAHPKVAGRAKGAARRAAAARKAADAMVDRRITLA